MVLFTIMCLALVLFIIFVENPDINGSPDRNKAIFRNNEILNIQTLIFWGALIGFIISLAFDFGILNL